MKRYAFLAAFCLVALQGCGFKQVDEGYRGIYTRFGKVEGEPLAPGLHFYNPITASIFEMSVREEKRDNKTAAFTKDTQNVGIDYTVIFAPTASKIGYLYSQFGRDWEAKIVDNLVLGTMKDVVGQYNADELVSKREAATEDVKSKVRAALASKEVAVSDFQITNLDFNDEYEKAVEEKVTAVQNAAKEKNKTVQIQEQAKQTLETAKASAEAMRIKSQALSQNKGLVQYEAVQRWNGVLPQFIMGGQSMPMLDMRAIMNPAKDAD